MELIETDLSERIIGGAIRVHRALGPGFLETVYENALVIELERCGLAVHRQRAVTVYYEEVAVGEHRLDLIVNGRIVVELKACKGFEDVHLATLRSYLKATGLPLSLLLNFARATLEIRRVVLTA